MPDPGDVVVLPFAGARETKRRPAVVVSSAVYHDARPDVIVGILTTRVHQASAPTDYVLQDWAAANLRAVSAFRSFFLMAPPSALTPIGHLTSQDWHGVRRCIATAFDLRT